MNDYAFGNYIYELRCKAGLTQEELARHLHVTNKAILEIELSDETQPVRFPDLIRVIREVTEDESYKNSSLARI